MIPGEADVLTIFGQPGTVVGLSAVDKAVLLLNNKNVLHKNKVGKGGSHMRPRMDFHLVLHGEYL